MVNNVFLKRVTVLVCEVHMYCRVVGIDLPAALVHGHEYRLNARCSLCHNAYGTGGRDCKTGNITTTVLLHILVQPGISLAKTVDERIVLLALDIEYLECTSLLGKLH